MSGEGRNFDQRCGRRGSLACPLGSRPAGNALIPCVFIRRYHYQGREDAVWLTSGLLTAGLRFLCQRPSLSCPEPEVGPGCGGTG